LLISHLQVEGRLLSDIINEEHVNVKYLPGVSKAQLL
jgi:hypothetical protein